MTQLIKYGSIEQFRHVVKHVTDRTRYVGADDNGKPIFDHSKQLPTLTFKGTVKIHGTNASIVLTKNGEYWAQSRERILSLDSDNAGFCAHSLRFKNEFEQIAQHVMSKWNADTVVLYGEWAGQGIQKGVAVSNVPKFFALFGIKVEAEGNTYWETNLDYRNESARIFSINDFGTFSIDIDFNNPELVQNKLIEITQQVEKECPVGKFFGESGVGEGVVWEHEFSNHSIINFKVKGTEHSVSKVTKLASVNVEEIENIRKFVEYAVTEQRLRQGLTVMKENQQEIVERNTPIFINWVKADVFKEEQDTIVHNGLNAQKVARDISNVARAFYLKECQNAI